MAARLFVWFILASFICNAHASESELDAMLYLDALEMQKKAVVCDARLPGFREKFEPAFEKWRQSNSKALSNGEKLLRAVALAEKKDFDFHVNAVTSVGAKDLERAAPARLKEHCDVLLVPLRQ